jgi:hypothetical protein
VGRLKSHQRIFLIKDWELRVADRAADTDERGRLGPGAVEIVACGQRFIDWLKGEDPPHPDLREFVEERLEVSDRESEYELIAYEHDALAAAVEDLS